MVSYSKDIKNEVIRELNEKYGKQFLNYEKCKEVCAELIKEKEHLEAEINTDNTECYIGKAVHSAEELLEESAKTIVKSKEIIKDIETNLDEVDAVRRDIQNHLDKLNILQCTLQYMRVIQRIEYFCSELDREVRKKDDEQSVTIFANLCEISRNLTDFTAVHLRNYLRETLYFWHNILKEKLGKDFDEVLKSIKWPFVNANFSLVVPLPQHIQKLQMLTEYLLQIEVPSESSAPPIIKSALLSDFPPLSLPIHFLVQPLRKRFLYHFYGNRQTNRPDKPEWYFTQILTWIRDHRDFIVKWVQPVVDKLGLHHIDARLELLRGLVQLTVEKLNSDLPNMQFDDFTFSHAVDEALGFDKELRETYDYPSTQPSILAVLTQAHVFVKWISMEKKYAVEKMDAILSPNAVDAFEPLASDIEDLKITACADAFIILQQTITERYESLPQPGHRLQFLELQLELFDDFRVRLLQITNAEEGDIIESRIPMIANSIYYIENVLVDWGSMLNFLNLYYYKSHLQTFETLSPVLKDFDDNTIFEETETVFSDTLSLYRHMRRDLLCTLTESVVIEVKRKSKNYRRERWLQVVVQKEFRSLSLTPSACPMFEILAKRLHQLQKCLASKLFRNVWRSVAKQIDSYLFEDLILDNRFSEGGALQFKYDVTRNLLPLFSQFSEKPENYFTQLIESCNLLNISKGTALLLRETLLALEGATGVEDMRGKALKDVGVSNFTPKMAVDILNRRADITINRISID